MKYRNKINNVEIETGSLLSGDWEEVTNADVHDSAESDGPMETSDDSGDDEGGEAPANRRGQSKARGSKRR